MDDRQVFGRYLLLERIAVGGIAEVFRAVSRPVQAGRPRVALKRLLPDLNDDKSFLATFLDAAAIAALLDHPNIAGVVEVGQAEGVHFVASEYVAGVDLGRALGRPGGLEDPIPPPLACRVLADVCAGLTHAHGLADEAGRPLRFLHRGLVPANVLLGFDGSVKLSDFGIAGAAAWATGSASRVLRGRFEYQSPEQVRGMVLDARSDLFTVGTLLYEALTGRNPFAGDSDIETLQNVVGLPLQPAGALTPGLPPELDAIVVRALTREREGRFASADELAAALLPHAGGSDELAEWLGQRLPERAEAERRKVAEDLDATVPAPEADEPAPPEVTSTDGPLRPGDVVGDRYRIERLIGRGGTAAVYEGFHTALKRRVAIKVLGRIGFGAEDELRRRFEREAVAAARLQSPHIAAVFDFGVQDGLAYMVQEYVSGRTLAGALRDGGAMGPGRAVTLALQACRALEHVHDAGLVHRDVKPSNFQLTEDAGGEEHLVLLDFGIAKIVEDWDQADMVSTATGMVLGTALYMSPEQAGGETVDARSDLYSLGCVLYQLLTGHLPFEGSSVIEVLLKHRTEAAPGLRDAGVAASDELEAVIARCLAKRPDERFASAHALAVALAATPEGRPGAQRSRPALTTAPPPPPARGPATVRVEAPWESSPTLQPFQAPRAAAPGAMASRAGGVDAEADPPPVSAPARRAGPGLLARLVDAMGGLLRGKPAPEPLEAEPEAAPVEVAAPTAAADDAGRPLRDFFAQAGLAVATAQRGLLLLERAPGSRAPDVRWYGVVLDDEHSPELTLATVAFETAGVALFDLEGTEADPCYVVALLRNQPGTGVYQQWHRLAVERQVHVLPLSPRTLAAAVADGDVLSCLRGLLHRATQDPFELEGPVLSDLDFFGSRDTMQWLLRSVALDRPGVGLFGLDKWGTTSMLYRLVRELEDRIAVFVDLAAIPLLDHDSLRAAVAGRAAAALRQRGHEAGGDEALEALVAKATAQADGLPPVVVLDRTDRLVAPSAGAATQVEPMLRALYRLASHAAGEERALVVLGGRSDATLTQRQLTVGGVALDNPLWRSMEWAYTPFFTESECAEFMERRAALAGLELTAGALRAVFRLTGGQKYLTRLVGRALRAAQAGRARRPVDEEAVERSAGGVVVAHRDFFEAVFDRAPEATREVLHRLAEGPATHAELLDLRNLRRRERGRDLAALQFARAYGLMIEDRGRYRLTMGLMGHWLRATGTGARVAHPEERPSNLARTIVLSDVPTPTELLALQKALSRAFTTTHDVVELADRLGLSVGTFTSTERPVGVQLRDLRDHVLKQNRYRDLQMAFRHLRPNYFPDGRLESLLQRARTEHGALRAVAMRVENGTAVPVALSSARSGESLDSVRVPAAVLSELLASGEPVVVDDAETDEHLDEEERRTTTGSFVAVPAMDGGGDSRTISGILLLSHDDIAMFQDDAVRGARGLASQLGPLLEAVQS